MICVNMCEVSCLDVRQTMLVRDLELELELELDLVWALEAGLEVTCQATNTCLAASSFSFCSSTDVNHIFTHAPWHAHLHALHTFFTYLFRLYQLLHFACPRPSNHNSSRPSTTSSNSVVG